MLKYVTVDLLTLLIMKIDLVFTRSDIKFEEQCKIIIFEIVKLMIASIDSPGVENMISNAIQYHMIMQADIEELLKYLFEHLLNECKIVADDKNLNIKSIRLWDLLKTLIKSTSYKTNPIEIFELLINEFQFENILIQEQIICI